MISEMRSPRRSSATDDSRERQPLFDLWVTRPSIDWAWATLLVGGHALVARQWLPDASLSAVLQPRQLESTGSLLAQVAATLAGFVLTALVFYYSTGAGERGQQVEKKVGEDIARGWLAAIRGSLLLLLGGFILAVTSSTWVAWVAEALILLTVLRMSRLLVVVGDFIDVLRRIRRGKTKRTASVGHPTAKAS